MTTLPLRNVQMITRTSERSPLLYARVAGLLYLLLLPLGIFGMVYVPSTLFVPGDAATTTTNIGVNVEQWQKRGLESA